MWVIGHTAFAYLLVKSIFIHSKRKFEPRLVIFVFIFANLIDTVHYGSLRTIFHNPIGTVIFAVFWLLFFEKCKIIQKIEFPLLLFATGTHVLGDVLFSDYFLLFPLNDTRYSIFGWNSPANLIVGSILTMVFTLVFVLSGDYHKLRKFSSDEKSKWISGHTFRELLDPSRYTFYLFIAFYLFTFAQLLFFLLLWFNSVLIGVWYVWMYCITFLTFFCVLTMILIGENGL